MIASLRGTVLGVVGTAAVIEVGGVGYSVQVTPQHGLSLRLGDEAFVLTTLIVREDALSLFGFADAESLEIFSLLVGVTGVGPKSAMGVLAELTAAEIARAVTADDDTVFRKVSGIGPKTAKLIVVSLTGKVAGFARSGFAAATGRPSFGTKNEVRDDVLLALVGLGWNDRSASDALEHVIETADTADQQNMQLLLRRALSELGPRQSTAGPR